MKILVIGCSGLIGTNLVNRLRHKGREAMAVSPALGVYAALFAAVCISAASTDDTAYGTSRAPLATACEIDPRAAAPLLIDRPATTVALSRRVQPVPTGGAQRPRPERSVRALLRAIQTIFHLARTAYVALTEHFSLSGPPWLRAPASLSSASREALTVRANGSDASSTPWHAV